jgi:choline-sulfatase
LAIEVVGDGIDQDCSGSDLAAAAPPPVTTRAGTPGGPPRQVVLVSFDALRADQLTAERMPNLLAFAAGGLTHTRAYSAAPATDLSFRATFSGWPPSDFDYRGHLVGMDRPLPLLLSDAGWQTFALHPIPDLGRLVLAGFQRVNESLAGRHLGRAGTSAAEITATALSLLRRPVDRSRLVWIHYLDPHAVYVPRPGYERFGDDLAGRYAQEVAATDAAMRPLLEHLADAEQTLTVVFADHGELLGEGGRWGHPNVLYPAVTRVPFVVRGPGIGPGRDDSPVSLLRIFPTVLGFAGIDVPARAEVGDGADVMMEGRDSSGAISTVALVRGDAMLHCDELAQVCERCDATAPLDCAPSPADPLRVALRGHLERYRNDAWYRARREVFAQWARAPSGSR